MTARRDFTTSRSASTTRQSRSRTSKQRDRRSRRVHEAILQYGLAIGLLTAPTRVWAFANPTLARRALRRREKDIQGKPIRNTLSRPENREFYRLLDGVYRTGVGFRGREVRLTVRSQPDARPVETHWTFSCLPKRNGAGKVDALWLYGRETKSKGRTSPAGIRQLRLEFERHEKEHAIELEAAYEQVRILSEQLRKARDEERTRISRELHDSTGQILAALSLNLCQARESSSNPEAIEKLGEGLRLVDEMSDELHAISRSLRPPILEQTSLQGAIGKLLQAFSARSGIRVYTDITPDLSGLTPDQEAAIFRVVQEGLTNVQRHSQSRTATVRIARAPAEIKVEVHDEGIGFQAAARRSPQGASSSGLGIAGMRERLRMLSGRLEIQSTESGTTLWASLPVRRAVISLKPDADRTRG